jgi:hypothetical protein
MKFIEAIGTLIAFIAVIAAVVVLWSMVWAIFAVIFALAFLVWAVGTRFEITRTIGKEKVVIGHLRWFKFTKVR